jgi:hypothetical protein
MHTPTTSALSGSLIDKVPLRSPYQNTGHTIQYADPKTTEWGQEETPLSCCPPH